MATIEAAKATSEAAKITVRATKMPVKQAEATSDVRVVPTRTSSRPRTRVGHRYAPVRVPDGVTYSRLGGDPRRPFDPSQLSLTFEELVTQLHFPQETHVRPNFSYASLAALAILASEKKQCTVGEIYTWVQGVLPFYRTCNPGWKNCIRHNLSMKRSFCKVDPEGNGRHWTLDPLYADDVLNPDKMTARGRRRKSKTRRSRRKAAVASTAKVFAKAAAVTAAELEESVVVIKAPKRARGSRKKKRVEHHSRDPHPLVFASNDVTVVEQGGARKRRRHSSNASDGMWDGVDVVVAATPSIFDTLQQQHYQHQQQPLSQSSCQPPSMPASPSYSLFDEMAVPSLSGEDCSTLDWAMPPSEAVLDVPSFDDLAFGDILGGKWLERDDDLTPSSREWAYVTA